MASSSEFAIFCKTLESFDVHCYIVIIMANKTPELLCRTHSVCIKEIKSGHYQTLEQPQHE